MKKKFILFVAFLMVILSSCTIEVKKPFNNLYVEELNKETVDYYYFVDEGEFEKDEHDLYFKDGSLIPYINLKDAPALLDHSVKFDEPLLSDIYSYEISEGNFKLINSYGYECIFNHTSQTITFEDFNLFYSLSAGTPELYSSIYPLRPYLSSLESDTGMQGEYYNVNKYVIELEKYQNESIAILYDDGEYFLPLATFNDIFIVGKSYTYLQYNFEDLFFFAYENMGSSSSMGKICYDVERIEQYDLEYSRFAYHELVLLFDIQYGYQDVTHVQDFDKYFESLGVKEAFYSGNAFEIEQMLVNLLFGTLYDGHTGFIESSPFVDANKLDKTIALSNNKFISMHTSFSQYNDYKNQIGIRFYDYNVVENTAFISFNNFSDHTDGILSIPTSLDKVKNSTQLLAYAYNEILNNEDIENVVFDISTNTGGSSDCLLYAMAMIEGVASYALGYHNTGSIYKGYVVADLNCDGIFNDKGLLDLGYNVSILTTDLSFSCGNAFPVFIQDNNEEVKIFGKRSGGGTDCVIPCVTATGTTFMLSSTLTLLNKTEYGYTNNEAGCDVDVELSLEQLLDFEYIVELLNKEN